MLIAILPIQESTWCYSTPKGNNRLTRTVSFSGKLASCSKKSLIVWLFCFFFSFSARLTGLVWWPTILAEVFSTRYACGSLAWTVFFNFTLSLFLIRRRRVQQDLQRRQLPCEQNNMLLELNFDRSVLFWFLGETFLFVLVILCCRIIWLCVSFLEKLIWR